MISQPAPAPSPFPDRCPDCGAAKVIQLFRDLNGRVEYPTRVDHAPGCLIYRARAYDRREPVAHLLRIGSGGPETRTAEVATPAVADLQEVSVSAEHESTPDRVSGSTGAGERAELAAAG